MKITFEVETTCSRPFHVSVSDDMPMFELRRIILCDIEMNTILMKDDVMDLFIPCGDMCVSIPELSRHTVRTFIEKYPEYFHLDSSSIWTKIHRLFVMDRLYLDKIKSNQDAPIYNDIIPPKETPIIKNVFNIAVALLTGVNMT
jgi:hypothetical protein